MSWTYKRNTGELIDPEGTLVGTGYSGGDHGLHPEGVNNPALSNLKDIGPLPAGTYTFGEYYEHYPVLGIMVIPLLPSSQNNMMGRGNFYLHGDDIRYPGQHKASDGCIIMPYSVRVLCANSVDKILDVI